MKPFTAILCIAAISIIFISCLKSDECTSQITEGTSIFIGKADSKDKAKQNSCNKYCLEMDPVCDAIYRIWVTSPEGQAAGSPSKMKAMYKNRKLLDCVTITCAQQCMNKLNSGVLNYSVRCE